MCFNIFTYSPVTGHLDCFQFFTSIPIPVMNPLIYVCTHICESEGRDRYLNGDSKNGNMRYLRGEAGSVTRLVD